MEAARLPRPAVCAMGAVSPLGRDWPTTWNALLAGASACVSFCTIDQRLDLDLTVARVPGLSRTISRKGEGAAVGLARLALDQVRQPGDAIGVYGGSNHGETDLLLGLLLGEAGMGHAEQWYSVLFDVLPRASTDTVEWNYGACASGLLALSSAVQDSECGCADAVVVAADALSAIEVMGFRRLGATSSHGCRPFHTSRDGLLIGEGAAAIRLTTAAETDRAAIRILGLGLSCDAGHPTDPDPDGRWLGGALDDALRRAQLAPSDVKAIVCHGTGTQKNDTIEAAIIAERWGPRGIPITSVKGGLGHTMGAAGMFNVLVAVEACRTGKLPPTRSDGSALLDKVDVVCGEPRTIETGGAILALASGFGGNNGACVVGRIR